MSLYVLDTDVLTLYEKQHAVVCRNFLAHSPADLSTTVITVEEQLSSWYTLLRRTRQHEVTKLARAYQRLADNVQLLSSLRILSFTEAAIERYQKLLALKLNVRKMDLRIAAITLEHEAVLVTRNLQDFRRVPGLDIEDWTQ